MLKDKMKIWGVRDLLKDMKENNVEAEQFQFTYGQVQFDVLFLINRYPYEFLFGAIGHNFSFELKMNNSYEIDMLSDLDFYKLREILKLKPGKEKFNSFMFLKFFSDKIPPKSKKKKIEPDVIAARKSSGVDDDDRFYFKGWRHHFTDGNKVRNLEKTKRFLGDRAYEFCKVNNISSCWTNDPKEKKTYYLPDDFCSKLEGP